MLGCFLGFVRAITFVNDLVERLGENCDLLISLKIQLIFNTCDYVEDERNQEEYWYCTQQPIELVSVHSPPMLGQWITANDAICLFFKLIHIYFKLY